MRFFLIVTMIALGCTEPPRVIDEEFIPYITQFEEITEIRTNYSIVFRDNLRTRSGERAGGTCTYMGINSAFNIVRIDRELWERASEMTREALIFHEAGHCTLGLDDNYELSQDGDPDNIMYYMMFNTEVYKNNRDRYIEQIKSHAFWVRKAYFETGRGLSVDF